MLQIKIWTWDVNKPNGNTAVQIEKEINKFLKDHKVEASDFEIFLMEHGIMFARAMYTVRKSSKK